MIKNRCYMRTGLVPVFYCAAFIMPSLSYAADPVVVNQSDRKTMYGTAAVRPTPDAFDLASRGMCYVATDTNAVTEWTGTAWISAATCGGGAGSSSTSPAYVVPLVDGTAVSAANPLPVDLATKISGEDQDNDLLKISGGKVRSTLLMSGVTTDTTTALVELPTGKKTLYGKVAGTGAVTQTQAIYGDEDDDAGAETDGVLLCTMTLSGTTQAQDACGFDGNYLFYYVITTNTTGTGASGSIRAMY